MERCTAMMPITQVPGTESPEEEMELASERKTAEHPCVWSLEWAKTRMPGKNNEAESTSGASGKSEKRQCSGDR